ncbi:MAG: hypothetical protein JO041_14150 [Acidobacteria bacterium]|nr:hypothetical protein [Acidobacteriota bacterium]
MFEGEIQSCATRFHELLALDHSQREPWGSRHGLAFATYALQHPGAFPAATLDRSWIALHRIYGCGDDPGRVFERFRREGNRARWDSPPRPTPPEQFPRVTIADLANFEAETYAEMLDQWARATLDWYEKRKT